MLKINELIQDKSIVEDYTRRKGYTDKIRVSKVIKLLDKSESVIEEEIDNPESLDDYFDRIITQHITHIVQDFRDKNVAKEHKAEKVEL